MGRTLTNEDVKGAIDLYKSLPAATFFRGLTGYGLISESGVEKVGEITSSSGIWKPMYFFITGGEKKGRKTLTAENVKKAVEKFVANELFALLKVTTGWGIKVDNGMSQLVDIKEAAAGINFELTHFGGRSIVPRMEVELSKLQDPNIKWQSGFLYQSQGNKAPAMNKNLILTRVLAEDEFDSQEKFDRVWQDIDKEVKRLMFMHCDSSSLPASRGDYSRSDRIRAFFSQELTTLVPQVQIDVKKPGYEYSIRRDGTVVIQKSIRPFEYQDEQKFAEFMAEFTKECYRVYTLYCNPLTDAQRGKLGRPVGGTHGLIETGEGEFERDTRRSTETEESLITWIGRRPGFPYEGWSPEKGKEYFFFQHAWGKGYRVSPGQPRYEWRYTDNEDGTYSKVEIRTEYDGTEKEVPGSKTEATAYKTRDDYVEGYWSSKELVITGKNKGHIIQSKTDHKYYYTEVVSRDGSEIEESRLSDKTEEFPFERKVPVTEFTISPSSDTHYGEGYVSGQSTPSIRVADFTKITWRVIGNGTDTDGNDTSYKLKVDDSENVAWDKIPAWLQKQHEAQHQLCKCGRERYDVSNETECRLCRDYRDCPRCEKFTLFTAERIADGATCCKECGHWYEGREQWINQHLGADGLQKIRDAATNLLNAPCFCEYPYRSRNVQYALSDGVYETQFSQEDLETLAALPDSGNELVKFIWAVHYGRRVDTISSDYTEEKVQRIKERLDTETNILAKFVRATDDIIKAVEELREEVGKHFDWNTLKIADPHPFDETDIEQIEAQWSEAKSGNPSSQQLETLRSLKKKLVDEVEEHRAKIEAERQAKIAKGEIWPDVKVEISDRSQIATKVFCIAPDGSLVEPQDSKGFFGDLPTTCLVLKHETSTYSYMYEEKWEVALKPEKLTDEQIQKAHELEEETRRFFKGKGTGWDLEKGSVVCFTTCYTRDLDGEDREAFDEMYSSFPVDVSEYEQWVGEDPYGGVHELEPGTIVVGPYKKSGKANPPEATEVVISASNGYWTPTADPQMAKKGWFLCPNGHSEKIKKAESGQRYLCGICGREYSVK